MGALDAVGCIGCDPEGVDPGVRGSTPVRPCPHSVPEDHPEPETGRRVRALMLGPAQQIAEFLREFVERGRRNRWRCTGEQVIQ